MNDILQPPAERDLPAGRADRIRAGALAAVDQPSHTGRRVAVLAAVATTVAAGVGGVALWPGSGDGGSTQVLAMSAAELSPDLREAGEQCVRWSRQEVSRTAADYPASQVTLDDLAVATRQGDRSAMLFLTGDAYFTCDVVLARWKEVTGSTSFERWGRRAGWLPGPVEVLSLSSSDLDGGDVMVIGRASARVRRLVLEHGDGRTTAARLRDGAFGLISTGGPVHAGARLVSYDAGGEEIGRMPLFDRDHPDRCYADPSGAVLYPARAGGKDAPPPDPATCLPTEAWR